MCAELVSDSVEIDHVLGKQLYLDSMTLFRLTRCHKGLSEFHKKFTCRVISEAKVVKKSSTSGVYFFVFQPPISYTATIKSATSCLSRKPFELVSAFSWCHYAVLLNTMYFVFAQNKTKSIIFDITQVTAQLPSNWSVS